MSKRNDKITTTKEGEQTTGENYNLSGEEQDKKKEGVVKEELREGVE